MMEITGFSVLVRGKTFKIGAVSYHFPPPTQKQKQFLFIFEPQNILYLLSDLWTCCSLAASLTFIQSQGKLCQTQHAVISVALMTVNDNDHHLSAALTLPRAHTTHRFWSIVSVCSQTMWSFLTLCSIGFLCPTRQRPMGKV